MLELERISKAKMISLEHVPFFEIPFVVPYQAATRDLDGLNSHTTFAEFLAEASKKMGVSVSHLIAIGLVASYLPKSPKPIPKLVEDETGWQRYIGAVFEWRNVQLAKKHGKGKIPPFHITVVDTSEPEKGKKVCSCPLDAFNIKSIRVRRVMGRAKALLSLWLLVVAPLQLRKKLRL